MKTVDVEAESLRILASFAICIMLHMLNLLEVGSYFLDGRQDSRWFYKEVRSI